MFSREDRIVTRQAPATGLLAAGLVVAAVLSASPLSADSSSNPGVSALPPNLDGGFNQDSVSAFTERNADALGFSSAERQVIGALVLPVIDLRRALAGEALPAGSLVGPKEVGLVERALELGPDGPPPQLWLSFFQGSTVALGRALAPIKRAGFYNAAVDGWILTDWRETAAGLELVAVTPLAGGVAPGPVEEVALPAWTGMVQESVASALAQGHDTALKLFRADNPLLSTEPPSAPVENVRGHRIVIESRLGTMRRSLSVLNQPSYINATRSFLDSVDSGDPTQLAALVDGADTASLHWVAGLLIPLRSRFQPTGVIRQNDGVTVLFGIPQNGRWVLVANYGLKLGDQPLSLQSIGFVDLNVAESWRAEQ